MDVCKCIFNILAAILVLMGLTLVGLGFSGPALHKDKELLIDDGTKKYTTQLKVAFFGIAITGGVLVGLAVLGLISINRGLRLLSAIFYIVIILTAVLLLILAGVAFGAVYLRTKAFKNFWRPKMEKYDPTILSDPGLIAQVHGLQIKLRCCGLSDEDVYQKHPENLPFSCCFDKNPFPGSSFSLGLDPKKLIDSAVKSDSTQLLDPATKAKIPLTKCTKATVPPDRKGCDVAGSEGFILMGKIISWASLIIALHLIAVAIFACCVRRRGL